MKVYVVIKVWYNTTELVACFSDKKKAEKFLHKQELLNKRWSFSIEEMDLIS